MSQHCHFDASRSLTALEQDSTIIAVIEMSQTKWLVAALIPGVERQPLKKFDAHEETLLKLLHRWRREAGQAGVAAAIDRRLPEQGLPSGSHSQPRRRYADHFTVRPRLEKESDPADYSVPPDSSQGVADW